MSQTDKPLEIAIIGVGFTGMMTAVHLIKKTTRPLTLHLINDKYDFGKGPAYSTNAPRHILNVPAAKMTAFADQPSHFLDWAHSQDEYKAIDKDVLGRVFMPRRDFGRYLSDVWADALANKRPDTTINIVSDLATDIKKDLNKNIITTQSGKTISVDYVILATGNETPRDIPVSDPKLYDNPNYLGKPWGDNATNGMDKNKDILIVGNGLTMVDIVLSLIDKDFNGTIHTISPDGLAIYPHRHGHVPYAKLVEELKAPYKISEIYSLINKHIKLLLKAGLSPEPVIDSLRPLTQKIWDELATEDKQRFLKHHMSHWNQIRHRMPGHMYDYLTKLRLEGKLVVHKGRVTDLTESGENIKAELKEVGNKAPTTLSVGRVINCIGPSTNVSQSFNPLLKNLVAKGTIQADTLKIGIHTTSHWTVINAAGEEVPTIYTIGGNLRGLLWETTAVPELRGQAEKLATEILAKAQ